MTKNAALKMQHQEPTSKQYLKSSSFQNAPVLEKANKIEDCLNEFFFQKENNQQENTYPRIIANHNNTLKATAPAVEKVRIVINGPAVVENMAYLNYEKINSTLFEQWLKDLGETETIHWFEGNYTKTITLLDAWTKCTTLNQTMLVEPGTHQAPKEGDWRGIDVAMTVAAMTNLPAFDTILLIPGNADLEALITFLKQQRKKVLIVNTQEETNAESYFCLPHILDKICIKTPTRY